MTTMIEIIIAMMTVDITMSATQQAIISYRLVYKRISLVVRGFHLVGQADLTAMIIALFAKMDEMFIS